MQVAESLSVSLPLWKRIPLRNIFENYLDVDVFRHPFDESMGFREARPSREDQLNRDFYRCGTRVALGTVRLMHNVHTPNLGKCKKCVRDVDVFFGNRSRQISKHPCSRRVFDIRLEFVRNDFHRLECDFPPLLSE